MGVSVVVVDGTLENRPVATLRLLSYARAILPAILTVSILKAIAHADSPLSPYIVSANHQLQLINPRTQIEGRIPSNGRQALYNFGLVFMKLRIANAVDPEELRTIGLDFRSDEIVDGDG